MKKISAEVKTVRETFKKLKSESGSHSPSYQELKRNGIHMNVDACFLSNPYATDLLMDEIHKDLIITKRFREYLEFYPSQNDKISKHIGKNLMCSNDNIFVGNGAIELIQAVLHNFAKGSLCIPIPTFSSYYEFLKDDEDIHYYQLSKSNDYRLNLEEYADYLIENGLKNALIINPNNPDGGYNSKIEIEKFLGKMFNNLDLVILDESFIHFVDEEQGKIQQNQDLINTYNNLVIIKSMSKDFGVAGLRAGYALMGIKRKRQLLDSGYLWNSNGLAEYFFEKIADKNFNERYLEVRNQYLKEFQQFCKEIRKIKGIKVLESKANFVLIELIDGKTSFELTTLLLGDYGVYVRDCNDKIGLQGEYVRIAVRSAKENKIILNGLKSIYER